MSYGEMGIPAGFPDITPAEMGFIRKAEFENAMADLGLPHEVIGLPDLGMSLLPLAQVVDGVIKVIRYRRFDTVLTFHPHEVTWQFDHLDHNTVGQAVKIAAGAADVRNFFPQYPALSRRPHLYYWTTNMELATHYLPLSERMRQNRNRYLLENHASQFPREKLPEWGVIFDRITYEESLGQHVERYVEVR